MFGLDRELIRGRHFASHIAAFVWKSQFLTPPFVAKVASCSTFLISFTPRKRPQTAAFYIRQSRLVNIRSSRQSFSSSFLTLSGPSVAFVSRQIPSISSRNFYHPPTFSLTRARACQIPSVATFIDIIDVLEPFLARHR
jgi:hypothetical protein